jgi:predicted CoA-substrate-specific enzyme activase
MITIGIDVGSITTKAAVFKASNILATHIIHTGYNAKMAGQHVFSGALMATGLSAKEVDRVVATGFGRKRVSFADKVIQEIACHGAGAVFLNPEIRSIIDIGGQDSKVMVVDDTGQVKDFAMNNTCATGTGRFLEVMARALEVDLEEFGNMSLKARKIAHINSACTAFAESEVLSLISKGEKRENIIAGLHVSIAERIVEISSQMELNTPIMMTGGVSKNIGVVRALEDQLECPVFVAQEAQITGAIGAGLIAYSLS